MYYFAYGSNMNQRDLDTYCKRKSQPSINLKEKRPQSSILMNYMLVFDYNSATRGGGVADLRPSVGQCVEGILFDIDESDLIIFDKKEGYHGIANSKNTYNRIKVSVTLNNGAKIPDVITYMVSESKRQDPTPPTKEYLRVIIEGAMEFGLSTEWIQKLRSIATK